MVVVGGDAADDTYPSKAYPFESVDIAFEEKTEVEEEAVVVDLYDLESGHELDRAKIEMAVVAAGVSTEPFLKIGYGDHDRCLRLVLVLPLLLQLHGDAPGDADNKTHVVVAAADDGAIEIRY